MELRRTNGEISLSKDRTVSGHIPLFRNLLTDGNHYERFAADSFKTTDMSRCVLAMNHNLDQAVAGVHNNTLRISFDSQGVSWEADVAKTTIGDDTLESIRSGLTHQCSLRFWVDNDDVEINRGAGQDGLDSVVFNRVQYLMDLANTAQGAYSGETYSRIFANTSALPRSRSISKTFLMSALKLI